MPLMLLFVCNGTDHGSILSDTCQMLDLAYDDIEINGMIPEEFENKDIPEFSLRVNVPRMPSDGKKTDNKAFDHYKNQRIPHHPQNYTGPGFQFESQYYLLFLGFS